MMKFMDKEIEDLVVTLPFADGSEQDCGVAEYFIVDGKEYFALLPLIADRKMDYTKSFMLYRVEADEEGNPVVVYIEDDYEYALAAKYFADHFLDRLN